MAPKKKPNVDEDIKNALNRGARAVGEAARNVWIEHGSDEIFGAGEDDWSQMIQEVDAVDGDFLNDAIHLPGVRFNAPTQGTDDVEVRVMKVGPDGKLTDVSGTVNLKDLRPDQIVDVRTDKELSGRTITEELPPRNRVQALKFLQDILQPGRSGSTKSTTEASITKMKETLAESDKILEHWKK